MTDPFYIYFYILQRFCIEPFLLRVYYLTNPLLFWFVNPLKHCICDTFFEVIVSSVIIASFALFTNVVICILSSDASHQIQGDLHSFHLPRHISGFGNSFQDCCEGHSRKSNRNLTLSSLASMKPLRSVSYFRQA